MNVLEKFELQQIEKVAANKQIPDFAPGDTVRVSIKIVDGDAERLQAYEGIVVARKNRGLNSSFTVRKVSHGEGVERVFPLYSPRIASIELVRKGEVRRAKLYYIRELEGKAARITEKRDEDSLAEVKASAENAAAVKAAAAKVAAAAPKAEKKKAGK
ncbi:MAG: 50S ribosomal protein L19 [Proteobacteria bacterium]|nr:50S ribosomal protein L19 [Pseudomonadota bacterium]